MISWEYCSLKKNKFLRMILVNNLWACVKWLYSLERVSTRINMCGSSSGFVVPKWNFGSTKPLDYPHMILLLDITEMASSKKSDDLLTESKKLEAASTSTSLPSAHCLDLESFVTNDSKIKASAQSKRAADLSTSVCQKVKKFLQAGRDACTKHTGVAQQVLNGSGYVVLMSWLRREEMLKSIKELLDVVKPIVGQEVATMRGTRTVTVSSLFKVRDGIHSIAWWVLMCGSESIENSNGKGMKIPKEFSFLFHWNFQSIHCNSLTHLLRNNWMIFWAPCPHVLPTMYAASSPMLLNFPPNLILLSSTINFATLECFRPSKYYMVLVLLCRFVSLAIRTACFSKSSMIGTMSWREFGQKIRLRDACDWYRNSSKLLAVQTNSSSLVSAKYLCSSTWYDRKMYMTV